MQCLQKIIQFFREHTGRRHTDTQNRSSIGTGAVINECRNDVFKQRIQQGSNIAFSAESYKFLSLRTEFRSMSNRAAVPIKTSQPGGTMTLPLLK
jgi:hypothetical protein